MRISDWSSDVCSSDLQRVGGGVRVDRAIISGGVRRIGGEPVGEAVPIVGIGAEIGVGDANRPHEIGRAHVLTPVTNAHLVCRLLLEKKNIHTPTNNSLHI